MSSRGIGVSRTGFLAVAVLAALAATAATARAQSEPADRFAAAVALVEERKVADARTAFEGIIVDYDTPANRANIEYDSLLAGSLYYLGETYFLEDRFEEAAAQYLAVIGAFRTYQAESLYHLGLSKHYRQDYAGAIAIFGDLAASYPGSPQAPQALYYQGACHELLKNKPAARAAFQTMVDRYPQHAWSKRAWEKAHE